MNRGRTSDPTPGDPLPGDPIPGALRRLLGWAEAEDFAGSDPYDLLASGWRLDRLPPAATFVLTQLHKRNPVDLRRLLRIPKLRLPKGMGLFLKAYSLRAEQRGDAHSRAQADRLFRWLMDHRSAGYAEDAWGLPFAYSSRVAVTEAWRPSSVVTSFVHDGLFHYGRLTGSAEAEAAMRSACDFLLHHLHRTERDGGLCFSYTPDRPDQCFNANALAAAMLARTYAVTGEPELLGLAHAAADYVVAHQKDDGRWNYSIQADGSEKQQIDFHQGFILDALHDIVTHSDRDTASLRAAIERGAAYYRREQFTGEGRSLWRVPREWPVDIHNQAQGIITFARLHAWTPDALPFAEQVARWTVEHMQDPGGWFCYRLGRHHTNRLPHMRWGQAWMTLALTHLLVARDEAAVVRAPQTVHA
ncbi:MAG: hypothetical protein AAGI91_08940 [Bacteroidota bacterium]